jgi:hypothetical protein
MSKLSRVSSGGGTRAPAGLLLAAAAAVLAVPAPARAELTHRYSFNDGTANDSVGGAHGVIVNAAPVSGGQINFSGNTGQFSQPIRTAQYVDLPNQIARMPTLTLETWATYRGGTGWQEIATFGTGTAGEIRPGQDVPAGYAGRDYVALIPASGAGGTAWGTIRRDVPPGAPLEQPAIAPQPLALNREYHFAYTVDFTARTAALFIDGVEAVRREITIDPSLQDQVNNWLGRSQWTPDPFFNGSINEFRIYNTALTAQEAAESYRLGPDVVPEPSAATISLASVAAACSMRRRRRADQEG